MVLSEEELERRIFLDALVSYADACTLPLLTPSCPFYRLEGDHATCGEECRTVIANNGGTDRQVAEVDVSGLLLRGRLLPVSTVAGASDFDATQSYLEGRELPLSQQSTSCLFVSLRTVVAQEILKTGQTTPYSALSIWGELARRGVDVDRAAVGGLTRGIAQSIGIRAILEKVRNTGLIPDDIVRGESGGWTALLDAAYANRLSPERAVVPLVSIREILPRLGTDEEFDAFEKAHPEVGYAFSRPFLDRISDWFTHQIVDDLELALSGAAPDVEMFLAFKSDTEPDEVGTWIWERFTTTDLASWHTSSLVLEWRWARDGVADSCSELVLAERRVSAESASEAALERISQLTSTRRSSPGLDAGMFVERATELLLSGEWDRATKVFAGLRDLRPGDGEAWNNLGFCLLAGDPPAALEVLERAILLQHPTRMISYANLALALHMANRDEDAIRVAAEGLRLGDRGDEEAYVWSHPSENGDLELGDSRPKVYLTGLLEHIRTEPCTVGQSH